MKNKILSYLLGGLLTLSLYNFFWYVNAQSCECDESDEICIAKCNYYSSDEYKKNSSQDKNNSQDKKECKDWCCGIKLNTNFPGIWKCIETSKDAKTNPTNAFPTMIWTLTRIIISFVLVGCFIMIIVGWIMRAWDKPKEWKDLITKVAITILLLWFSWVILRLINPNFFG